MARGMILMQAFSNTCSNLHMKKTAKEQHKRQIYENLFHKLEAMGCHYKNSLKGTVLCNTSSKQFMLEQHVMNAQMERNVY